MLASKVGFCNLSNITRFQQLTQLNSAVRWRTLHIASMLSQVEQNQSSAAEPYRVYYGENFVVLILFKLCNSHDFQWNWKNFLSGSLSKNIKSVKVFSLTTSFAGVIAQPMLYDQATKIGQSMPLTAAICGMVGFFTFVTPFLLHVITKKYVTELFYDPVNKEYIAEIITFFLTRQRIHFKVEDVEVPDVPGMFTSFIVKPKSGKPVALFVDPKLFDDPTHYIKIMGYDKPIDFKFEELQKKKWEMLWFDVNVLWWESGNKIWRDES